MSAEPKPESKRAAPLALWRALRAFLATMFSLFGEPQEIAALGLMRRKQHALMLAWLRAGEAFLRRLLFIEALALIGPAAPSAASKPAPRKPRQRKLMCFHPDQPEDWRVSFRVIEPRRAQRPRSHGGARREPIWIPPAFRSPRPKGDTHYFSPAPKLNVGKIVCVTRAREPRNWPNAWPLAERLEAMLRTYNDPFSHARRLARALQRRDDCAARVLKPQPPCVAIVFGPYFAPCDRIAEKRRRSWPPPQPPDTG
ncbi:MAG: hypothetical protein ACT4OF_16545 [Caulobacteraceae bacterium]